MTEADDYDNTVVVLIVEAAENVKTSDEFDELDESVINAEAAENEFDDRDNMGFEDPDAVPSKVTHVTHLSPNGIAVVHIVVVVVHDSTDVVLACPLHGRPLNEIVHGEDCFVFVVAAVADDTNHTKQHD